MAGHFLLENISTSELAIAQQELGGAWSALQHDDIGWNDPSRGVLRNALQGTAIGNRDNLPPHRYLQINAENPIGERRRGHIQGADWVDRLVRPASDGLGLRNLCPDAAQAWNAGNRAGAVIEQVQHGAVAIEIYRTNGEEIV